MTVAAQLTTLVRPLVGPTDLLIDGSWTAAGDGRRFAVDDPATGETIASVADASSDDALRALAVANERFAAFAGLTPSARSDLLTAAHRLLVEREEQVARLITLEMGKPLAESRGEVRYAADYLRWFAGEALRVSGSVRQLPDASGEMIVTREPVGVCVLITPWNFPLAMAARKIAPALAAGCTSILKPAPQTPLTSLVFGQLLLDAGVPNGVVNVLPSNRARLVAAALLADPRTRKVSFTGSTEVGRLLLRQAADGVLRSSMELGGNAPFLVFEDADLDAAIDGAMIAKLRNGGQACTAANRFLVHSSVIEQFAERLSQRFAGLRLAPGSEPGSELGPLIDDEAVAKVLGLIDDARSRGATVRTGGSAPAGRFFQPTVVTGITRDARINREEIFGPVAAITGFDDEAEAVALANETEYGLVAYLYTRDVGRAMRVSGQLQSGMLAVNRGHVSSASAPFGGIKASGLGREGGTEGIDEYVQLKYLALDAR
jgi:succinate-semialdehyde dehydrogenase/glutarate-semialdehyde dehydrogenase